MTFDTLLFAFEHIIRRTEAAAANMGLCQVGRTE